MTENFETLRARVRAKVQSYYVYDYKRCDRRKIRLLNGALDAFFESRSAEGEYGTAVHAGAKTLACYGFLQALYVQQDAVATLSKGVGLNWAPKKNRKLRRIREARDRLTGHPSEATDGKQLSSAILYDITEAGFVGAVYFEEKSERIAVNAEEYRRDNEQALIEQIKKIEKRMDDTERTFRTRQAKRPISAALPKNFDYLVRRIYCTLTNRGDAYLALSHIREVRATVFAIQKDLANRRLDHEGTRDEIGRALAGLDLLEVALNADATDGWTQYKYAVIYDGLNKAIEDFRTSIGDIDKKLNADPSDGF